MSTQHVNKVELYGVLANEPKVRETPQSHVVNLRLHVRGPAGKGGSYLDVVVWGEDAVKIGEFCAEGVELGVKGRIQKRSWTKNDGTTVWNTEVVANTVDFGAVQDAIDKGERNEPVEEEEIPF